ncbi:MAG: hypothetical protein EOP48_14410, partial [Sphingobacteriales bacterium]
IGWILDQYFWLIGIRGDLTQFRASTQITESMLDYIHNHSIEFTIMRISWAIGLQGLLLLTLQSCAVLHKVQLSDVENTKGGEPLTIKVSETTVDFREAGSILKAVGKKKPNSLMLFDMCGNASEWCYDFYDANYYAISPAINPVNRNASNTKIARGGASGAAREYCTNTYRYGYNENTTGGNLGFRVCRVRS